MKIKIQNKIGGLGNTIRNVAEAENKRRQQAETAELQPAFASSQAKSIFGHLKFEESGIAFSPLND